MAGSLLVPSAKTFYFVFIVISVIYFILEFILIYFLIFWPHHMACGSLVPNQGSNLCPLHWKHEDLTHWTAREVQAKAFELDVVPFIYFCFCFPYLRRHNQKNTAKTNVKEQSSSFTPESGWVFIITRESMYPEREHASRESM